MHNRESLRHHGTCWVPVLYEVLSITVELHCKRPLCNAMPTYSASRRATLMLPSQRALRCCPLTARLLHLHLARPTRCRWLQKTHACPVNNKVASKPGLRLEGSLVRSNVLNEAA